MDRRKKNIGDWGENRAVEFLRRHGFEIVEKNFFTTQGEIDIVAEKGDDIYFVEVKTRTDSQLARDQAIDSVKKRHLERAARAYCFRRQVPVGRKSLLFAGLIIFVDKINRRVRFRFVVLQDQNSSF